MRLRLLLIALLAVGLWFLPYGLSSYAIHVANVIIVFALLAIGLGCAWASVAR